MEIIKFEVIDSTQNYAKKIAKEGQVEKAVVAKIQTAGRGRIGKEWQSLDGGLWFSFITDVTDFEDTKISFFTIVLGVSVYQACMECYDIEMKLKWPNDLLLNNKKVCGILCEKVENKIISGVGINTNINSKELIDCGTGFLKETGMEIYNIELLNKIIEKFYQNINNFNKNKMLEIYRKNMAYLNEKKFIKAINKEVIIKGIDESGALLINDNGIESKITFGEII